MFQIFFFTPFIKISTGQMKRKKRVNDPRLIDSLSLQFRNMETKT